MTRILSLIILVVLNNEADSINLANNQFLIYNHNYPSARITMFSEKGTDVGTYEHGLSANQLWTLQRHPYHDGCYYLVNEMYPRWRIADWTHHFTVYAGPHYPDQLFRFEASGDFYFIYNFYYTNDRMAKYGVGDNEVSMYGGPIYPDQLWKLVPRFEAGFHTTEVFHFDNRQGTTDIPRLTSVTKGVKRTSSSSIRNTQTFKTSMEASLEASIEIFKIGAKVGAAFTSEMERSFSQTSEESWSKTETITFTVPAGKNYKVLQHTSYFKGQFPEDSSTLLADIKIFESDTDHFDGEDDFIIDTLQGTAKNQSYGEA